ncbi:hypothetical protein XENOCAPTIV_028660 [Xenoophorus captivus]|uniref:Uncharacterized protein n=1 Tax=Xenoophorus captivus TaxID=1517983 RepID=A0ABV0RFJ5_9TELE
MNCLNCDSCRASFDFKCSWKSLTGLPLLHLSLTLILQGKAQGIMQSYGSETLRTLCSALLPLRSFNSSSLSRPAELNLQPEDRKEKRSLDRHERVKTKSHVICRDMILCTNQSKDVVVLYMFGQIISHFRFLMCLFSVLNS